MIGNRGPFIRLVPMTAQQRAQSDANAAVRSRKKMHVIDSVTLGNSINNDIAYLTALQTLDRRASTGQVRVVVE